MEPNYKIRGTNDLLEVFEDKVVITPKGLMGFLNKGLKGAKTIPFQSITAVQFKKPGLTTGYLQFSVIGGNESRGGVLAAVQDENTFAFNRKKELVEEIKNFIEARMGIKGKSGPSNLSEEFERLHHLKEKGIISEEEFIEAKKKLL